MRTYAHSRHGAPQPRHVAVAASPCAATRLRPKSRVSAGSLQSLIPTQRESESLNSKLVLACMPSWAWRSVLASPRPSGLVSCVLCRVLSLLVSLIARLLCLDLARTRRWCSSSTTSIGAGRSPSTTQCARLAPPRQSDSRGQPFLRRPQKVRIISDRSGLLISTYTT